MARTPFVFSDPEPWGAAAGGAPRASVQPLGGGLELDLSNPEHVQYLRNGGGAAGAGTMEGAMRVAAAYRCTHIIAGACGNLPIDLYKRTERRRDPAVGHPLRQILQRPNSWQTSSEFRKMLTAHAVLKGNGYAIKVTSRGRILALWPLKNPDRMQPVQNADMSLTYRWTRDDGSQVDLPQSDVLHLRGLTLDGVKGIGVISHARQALGLSLQAEEAAARVFKQGVIAGLVFSKPGTLSDEAFARLKQQIDENNAGAENARKALILEDDLKVDGGLMSAEDLQFLDGRKFTRSDVCMFFGVPPHMVGDTEKVTSWGAGIEAQGIGFVTYTANDWFVMWEEALARDCLDPVREADLYVRIQRQALMRGDLKARTAAYASGLQWGWMNPDEVRALEDLNPREDGKGGAFYDPPNTAGSAGEREADDEDDRPDPPR